jgi:adenylate cyclase
MGNLVDELKRRKVFRVAVFYAAAAWVLMQVADVVLPALRLPDWTVTAVVVALIAGLPIAVTAAWIFDWTPEGIYRDSQDVVADRTEPAEKYPSDSLLDRLAGQEKSLAVLPFSNLSGDPEQEYFSDGLVDDIITDLSLIPGLMVISRHSTFTYKGAAVDVRAVGPKLNVNYILQGSVRRSGDQLRVTAQLVECATGENIWSKRYDRKTEDIFKLQDDLTSEIVSAMDVELVSGEQGLYRRKRYRSERAGEALYKGIFHHNKFERAAMNTARRYYEELIELEPDSVLGYVWLVSAWTFSLIVRWAAPEKALPIMKENIDKALSIDANDPQALIGDTYYSVLCGDLDHALEAANNAVQIAPSAEEAWFALGWAQMLDGATDSAIRCLERSARLCPTMRTIHWGVLGTAYRNAGRYKEAIETFKGCIRRFPDFIYGHSGLAVAYVLNGDDELAAHEVAEVLRQDPTYSIERFTNPNLYRDKSIMDVSAEALRKAGMPER